MRKLSAAYILSGMVCGISPAFAQNFGIPTIPTPQPATMPRYDNYGGTTPMPNVNGQVKIGATADDILRQANRNSPYYQSGNSPADNQRATEAWIHAQMANDPAYNPSLRNGVRNNFPINKQQELHELLQDIIDLDNSRMVERGSTTAEDFASPAFSAKTKAYTDALQTLKNMLSGKQKLSIADAYFSMESAYGEAYLTKHEYNDIIKQSADFIRLWMKQNNLNLRSNTDINFAVQQFIAKKQDILVPEPDKDGRSGMKTITHLPFRYDYNDYTGEKDHRNYFLTKCLATGMGQCNSLPAVYLVLVEALGGTAYLAVAPQHSLIKYPDKSGKVRNYEPTSNWDISDQWYQEHMFISQQAINNGIYLSPYSKKQIVGDIALQLSFGYFRKFGAADEKFMKETIRVAESQFPNKNNIAVYFTYSNMYGYELAQVMRKHRIGYLSDIAKYPEAQALYNKWLENEKLINQLGYQDQPARMYEVMMKEGEFRGKSQEEYGISGKEKRSLFIKSK